MKALFAIKSLNVQGGGAERVLVQVANGLVSHGHEVSVITFDSPGAPFYDIDARIARIELGVGPPGKPTPRGALLASLWRMRSAVRATSPDIVVGFMHSMYVPLRLATAGLGIPFVASEHIGADHFSDRKVEAVLARLARGFSGAMTVPSESVRREFLGTLGSRMHVLPNPIDITTFRRAGELQSPTRPPVLLTVGRFMEQKNHIELIDAFSRVLDRFPDTVLRLVGDGVLRPRIEERITQLQLSDSVELPGMVSNVASEYARATIVVVPSRYESFGLVTAEAQACGRPVIGFSDCVGTNELLQDGVNGVLVPGSGDRVTALANAIIDLLPDAEKRSRLVAAGHDSVQRFSIDEVLRQWTSFLQQTAAGAPGDPPHG